MSAKKVMHSQPRKTTAHKTVQSIETKSVSEKGLFYLLIAIAGLLFANTLTHGFVLDDLAVIEQNRFVQDGISGIPKIFSTFYWEGYWTTNSGLYRPMSLVSFALEWQISPNNPFIHHFVQVVLYALSIGLLFKLLRRLFPDYSVWVPFGITLLFAIHPIHTEVVANIKSRDEILCFLFFELTFLYILKHGLKGFRHGLIAGLLFACCLLSKEAGILFLPIMGIYFLLFREPKWLAVLKLLLPLLLTGIVWLAWHQYVIRSSAFTRIEYTYLDNSVVGCDGAATQVATGFSILGHYLLKAIAPVNLSYDYSYNQIPCATFGSPMTLLALAAVAIGIWGIFRTRRTQPVIAFGIAFFLISIALITNIFTLIGATMGDRLLFTPVLGLCILQVFGLYKLTGQLTNVRMQTGAFFVVLAIAIPGALASYNRNKVWESNASLFTSDVNHAPHSARVHFNHGTILMAQLPENVQDQQPYLPEIIGCFQKALQIDSLDRGSHINLGVCYYRTANYDQSIAHTRAALRSQPNDTSLWGNLADAYFKRNQFDSAIVYYKRILPSRFAVVRHYNTIGNSYFQLKQYNEAIAAFEGGLTRFGENDIELLMNLGNACGAAGDFQKAQKTFLKLTELQPENPRYWEMLAMVSQSMGNVQKAQEYAAIASSKKHR